MEVAPPINPTDFDFNTSAYATAPPTPKLMNNSRSQDRITELYDEFDQLMISHHRTNSLATVPFAWEEKPGVPKQTTNLHDVDFAFDLSTGDQPYPYSSTSAEDLFHDGLIKPLEINNIEKRERGRERNYFYSGELIRRSRSRRTRSLPPFRGPDDGGPPSRPAKTTHDMKLSTSTTLSASGSGKGSKKWSFKDLFLFRSASDGRALLDKDPLKKYSAVFRKHDEDFRKSSLRHHGSGTERRGRVSAHELHYKVNRAVSNDMKKKTFLPYKQGILGKLAFNPTVHAISNGFGFSHNN